MFCFCSDAQHPPSFLPVCFSSAGRNFTEGWVEFQDKAVAKQVAMALNGQQMGGKRRQRLSL